MRRPALAGAIVLSLLGYLQGVGRADDSFRCGVHLVHLGDSPRAVVAACGKPADVRQTRGDVPNGDGTTMHVEYETWRYDLGPAAFARFLVFADGALTSITTGNYGR